MKKTIIITGIVIAVTIVALFIVNKVFTREDTSSIFTEVSEGKFEIAVTSTGELLAERSVNIIAPDVGRRRGIRSRSIEIQNMVSEGTEVQKGDWVATLDRTEYDNSLKDEQENLTEIYTELEMALLDTAVTLSGLRDQIENQIHTVDEAEITLKNSKYEPPTTIRQAEIKYDQAIRELGQMRRSYSLAQARAKTTIRNIRTRLNRYERRVKDYEEVLASFVINAPSPGMVIYYKDPLGKKRKAGSSINPMDRVVATLPDLSSMLSKVYISEIDITKIEEGQEVIITVDAFPDRSYTGKVFFIANIGEKLPNTDTKVFEVHIKLDGRDYSLRPTMTTNNKIIVKILDNVTYVPNECIHTGTDNIPVVYTKHGMKQVVIPGESNNKEIVIEKGLEAGTVIYRTLPENPDNFKIRGTELIETIKAERAMNEVKSEKKIEEPGKL
jgi:HlyD family secretion protein